MLAPKFQEQIYPDSVILLRGEDDYIRERGAAIAEDSEGYKWDRENLERRLKTYSDNNDLNLFEAVCQRTDLGHPKAEKPVFPMLRFFQEHKTEAFEIDCDGNQFEMFESMRIYIERNGRSFNYLHSVEKLNKSREKKLIVEENDTKANLAAKETEVKEITSKEVSVLEAAQ